MSKSLIFVLNDKIFDPLSVLALQESYHSRVDPSLCVGIYASLQVHNAAMVGKTVHLVSCFVFGCDWKCANGLNFLTSLFPRLMFWPSIADLFSTGLVFSCICCWMSESRAGRQMSPYCVAVTRETIVHVHDFSSAC